MPRVDGGWGEALLSHNAPCPLGTSNSPVEWPYYADEGEYFMGLNDLPKIVQLWGCRAEFLPQYLSSEVCLQ